MNNFGNEARKIARKLNYVNYKAEKMSCQWAKVVGDVIAQECKEPRLNEVYSILNLDINELDEPTKKFRPKDVALAAWSNWEAVPLDIAANKSRLTKDDFSVLNKHFESLYEMIYKK